jgi:S-adenosylmethionine synthetase
MERRTTERAGRGVEAEAVEVVERKGLGHPDTMCDAIMEEVAHALVVAYLATTGRVLPMNVDKALLAGGASRPAFGGGVVTAPMRLWLGGRAHAAALGGEEAVHALAVEAARAWLARSLRHLDVGRHVAIEAAIHPTSDELAGVLGARVRANDTSVGVGFAPPSRVERTVLEVDAFLAERRRVRPSIGEDVKIMAVRRDDALELTLAIAFVAPETPDLERYFSVKRELCEELAAFVRARGRFSRVEVGIDLLDDPARGDVYLTVTGTSAEAGDDGQVGRGNRVNGLISFGRPMSLEAAAGKNPQSHVGKIYNVLAHKAAGAIAELPGVVEAHVMLGSRIGRPLDDPAIAHADLVVAPGHRANDVLAAADAVLLREIAAVDRVVDALIAGKIAVY